MQANVATIVEEVWSPSEIVDCAATKTDELTSVAAPFAVPTAKRYAFRTSLVVTPFECLHSLWDPNRTPLTSSELLEKCDIRTNIVTWDQLANAEKVPGSIADRHKDGWFRFSSVFPTVTFDVNRSSEQLLCILAALEYSFPHLIVPFCDGQVSLGTAISLCLFVRQHRRELAAYLPLLFFLYERDEKLASSFLAQLDVNVKSRVAQEEKNLRAFKPKTSKGWFSWGSSSSSKKKDEPGMSLADQFRFMSEHSAELPPPFKELFVLAVSKCERMEAWHASVQKFTQAWRGRDAAFRSVVDALPIVAPPYETEAPCATAFTGVDDGDDLKRTSLMLHQFMQNVTIVTRETALPNTRALTGFASVARVMMESKKHHLEKILEQTQTSVGHRGFLTGKSKPPKEAPAYDNTAVFSSAVNAFTELQNRLRKCGLSLTEECEWADGETQRAEKQACDAVSALFHSEVDAFSANQHFKTVPGPTGEAPSSNAASQMTHPLLICLGSAQPSLGSDEL